MFVTALFDDFCGAQLELVRELLFDIPEEPGPPMREAIELCFGGRSLIIRALTDTSELEVFTGKLTVDEPNYQLRDASQDEYFQDSIGKPVRNWWVAQNDRGYTDAFMVAFEVTRGLCFV